MKKEFILLKKIVVLFLVLFVLTSCEQVDFINSINLLKGISKTDIDKAVLRMKEVSNKNSKPAWDVDPATAQYLQFDFNTIEGTEIVKAVYYESNKILIVARKDSKLKNVVQLYYIKNASIDGEYINFHNSGTYSKDSYCEDFIMVNLKNNVAIYGSSYTYPKSKDLMESINNMGWINSIINDKKIKYKRIYNEQY
ncbi:hypothetical protein [Candidatus Ruminimicrobium bovinum]|uniref:hypothetical protein n=1 Tax=Candidatus Ruminimicrobium bovinum TaxID=3242779 RepID=UPI0039B86E42